MTEKRFTPFTDYLGGTQTILDNGERKTLQELLDTMNELAEENEQLELDNKRLLSDYTDICNDNIALGNENEQLKQREQTLTAKIDRMLHQRDGNEKQHLKVMSYLHDNYYSIWEECLKELGD